MEKIINIPEFDTLQDMAQFWDTHEITDFEAQLQEVREPIFDYLNRRSLIIHLAPDQYTILQRLAEQEQQEPGTLIQDVVQHWLQDQQQGVKVAG